MLKKLLTSLLLCGLPLFLTIATSNAQDMHIAGKAYYYGDFSPWHVPPMPSKPLSYEEAVKQAAFFVVYYNDQDRIISFTKYSSGEIGATCKYFYGSSGTLEREEYSDNNSMQVSIFDANGKRTILK